MNTMHLYRHADKQGAELSLDGRMQAFQRGLHYKNPIAELYGSAYQSSPEYIGRGIETAQLIAHGNRNYDINAVADSRLEPKFSEIETKALTELAKQGKTLFQASMEAAKDGSYRTAKQLAEFVDSVLRYNAKQQGDIVAVTHDPNISLLLHYLGMDFDVANETPGFVEGLKVNYDPKTRLYTIVKEYNGKGIVVVEGSLAEKCDEIKEQKEAEEQGENNLEQAVNEGGEEGEAGE